MFGRINLFFVTIFSLFLCASLIGCSQPENPQPDGGPAFLKGPLIKQVNPLIGTGGIAFGVGSSFLGATAPFGMVKIGPDTGSTFFGNQSIHCSGYYYHNDSIAGFSHIHVHGTGLPDYGNLLLMPTVGKIDASKIKEKGYRAAFKHETEKASPGFYEVLLEDHKIKVELTATTRTAHHRYTYPASTDQKHVILRLDHALPNGKVTDAEFKIKSDKEIEGWLHSAGSMTDNYGGFKLYFVLKSKTAFKAGSWNDRKIEATQTQQKGAKIGAYLHFPKQQQIIELQVGISFVSIAQARKNLLKEAPKWDFDGTRKATEAIWEKELSVVKIAGGTEEQQKIFYTALYHSMLMPTILSDVDGQYRGLDQKVHAAKDFIYYSDFSLWDTYRTLHPLLVWLKPRVQRDMVRSLIAMMKQGGALPRWPLATGYTGVMVGASADIVIADTYLKGIKDFDVQAAYKGMMALAMKPPPKGTKYPSRAGIEHYVKAGYVAADKVGRSASITLEYAYNDFAIYQLAKALNKTSDAKIFEKRAGNYKHIWDQKTQFFRAKNSDGSWLKNFVDTKWTKDYVEGTAWQYLWFVPHDPNGLAKLFGSKKAMLKKLNTFFEKSVEEYERTKDLNVGIKKYYWHGNEPDLHAAMLYAELGLPQDTQKWVRWVMKHHYKNAPDGLAGNDDSGTLSAWYVFNALGLYPIPAKTDYILTSPVFTRAVIEVQGKRFEIQAKAASQKAIYSSQIQLNGKAIQNYRIQHDQLIKNKGILQFVMKENP